MLFYYVGYSARTLGQNAIFTQIEINIVNSANYWLHHFFLTILNLACITETWCHV